MWCISLHKKKRNICIFSFLRSFHQQAWLPCSLQQHPLRIRPHSDQSPVFPVPTLFLHSVQTFHSTHISLPHALFPLIQPSMACLSYQASYFHSHFNWINYTSIWITAHNYVIRGTEAPKSIETFRVWLGVRINTTESREWDYARQIDCQREPGWGCAEEDWLIPRPADRFWCEWASWCGILLSFCVTSLLRSAFLCVTMWVFR